MFIYLTWEYLFSTRVLLNNSSNSMRYLSPSLKYRAWKNTPNCCCFFSICAVDCSVYTNLTNSHTSRVRHSAAIKPLAHLQQELLCLGWPSSSNTLESGILPGVDLLVSEPGEVRCLIWRDRQTEAHSELQRLHYLSAMRGVGRLNRTCFLSGLFVSCF